VARVLQHHLDKESAMTHSSSEPGIGLSLQPMVHVELMSAAVAFYETLGATVAHG